MRTLSLRGVRLRGEGPGGGSHNDPLVPTRRARRELGFAEKGMQGRLRAERLGSSGRAGLCSCTICPFPPQRRRPDTQAKAAERGPGCRAARACAGRSAHAQPVLADPGPGGGGGRVSASHGGNEKRKAFYKTFMDHPVNSFLYMTNGSL